MCKEYEDLINHLKTLGMVDESGNSIPINEYRKREQAKEMDKEKEARLERLMNNLKNSPPGRWSSPPEPSAPMSYTSADGKRFEAVPTEENTLAEVPLPEKQPETWRDRPPLL